MVSTTPLPELPTAPFPDTHPTRVEFGAVAAPATLQWSTLWRLSGGEPWASVAREPGAYHVRVAGCAHFIVSPGVIQVDAESNVRPSTIRHLLLDQVLPLALAAEGRLVLHASALRRGRGAIAVAGAAGSGKSTIAAALSREGWAVMSDDGVLVDERGEDVFAIPAYPGLRLWPEALETTGMRDRCVGEVAEYSAKLRIAPNATGTEPARLCHVYVIERGDRRRIEPLGPREASIAVLSHVYRADLSDRVALAAQLEACARFVERVPVSRLTVRAGLAELGETARALGAHATFEGA